MNTDLVGSVTKAQLFKTLLNDGSFTFADDERVHLGEAIDDSLYLLNCFVMRNSDDDLAEALYFLQRFQATLERAGRIKRSGMIVNALGKRFITIGRSLMKRWDDDRWVHEAPLQM